MIRVKVDGHHLTKDNRRAGIQHEANAAVLRIEFDPGWDGFAKKITFWNADMKHPVERVLTADLLEDMLTSTRIYRCPIPGEAMEEAGELTFIIDGYVNGKRVRSITGMLEVVAAPYIDKAGEPSDPTPSQAEQLQAQVEALLGDIRTEAVRAEEARMVAERARDAAIAIIGGQLGPESFLNGKADLVNGKVPVAQLPKLTAEDVGAVAKAGDTMTGVLKLAVDGGKAILVTNSDCSYIHTCVEENTGNDVLLIVRNIEKQPDLNRVLTLAVQKDGDFKDYQVIHEGNKALIRAADIGAATTATYTATVSTIWQKSTDCWYQNIAVGGILATDNPIVDILPGNDNSANRLYSDAMTKVFRIATENGSIQVMATEAINIAFPIQLKVVR